MTTHGHEHPGIFHRRSNTQDRPPVIPRPTPETTAGIGNGGPANPGDFNDKNGDDDPRRFSRRRALAIGGGILGVAGIAGSAFVLGGGGKSPNSAPSTPETAPTVAASTAPATVVSPTVTSPSPSEVVTNGPAGITIDYAKFKDYTPAQFRKQKYDDQAQYDIVQYEDVEATGALSEFFEPEDPEGEWITAYNPARKPLGADSHTKSIEIIKANAFAEAMIKARKPDIHVDGAGKLDPNEAQKLIPGYAIGKDAVKSMIDTINNSTDAMGWSSSVTDNLSVVKTTDGLEDVDGDGVKDITRTIVMSNGDDQYTEKYAFKPNARLTEIAHQQGKTGVAGLWPLVESNKNTK